MVLAFIVVFLVMSVITFGLALTYNNLIEKRRLALEASDDFEEALERREKLLDELSSTIEAYLGHDAFDLGELYEARTKLAACEDVSAKRKASQEMEATISRILEEALGHPDLRDSGGFRALCEDLATHTADIDAAYKRFEEATQAYEKACTTRPWSYVATALTPPHVQGRS